MEERFCQKVKQLGCTCVTISHRPALMAFHDIVLALDGEGGWSLHRGARGLASEEHPPELTPGAYTCRNLGAQRMTCCCIRTHAMCLLGALWIYTQIHELRMAFTEQPQQPFLLLYNFFFLAS